MENHEGVLPVKTSNLILSWEAFVKSNSFWKKIAGQFLKVNIIKDLSF